MQAIKDLFKGAWTAFLWVLDSRVLTMFVGMLLYHDFVTATEFWVKVVCGLLVVWYLAAELYQDLKKNASV